MLSYPEALSQVLASAVPASTESVPLVQAPGRILQEPLLADRPFPPYDRVTMDGIVLRHADFASGQRVFRVAGRQDAGQAPLPLQEAGGCLEIMTGAACPPGADAVVRYEDVTWVEKDGKRFARVQLDTLKPGQNIHPRGSDRAAGVTLVAPGRKLGPAEVAVAASVGKAQLRVSRLPRIALVATGDELVPVSATPEPHQIRGSNGYTLQAALAQLGLPASRHHLRDERAELEQALGKLLSQHDLLLLSGGVSMGKADYIPEVLRQLGVGEVFHKVAQRPGKPLWFGRGPQGQVVFGLPGNPVSTFASYLHYVRPWLQRHLGQVPGPLLRLPLREAFSFRPSLTYFLQFSLEIDDAGRWWAVPRSGRGSGDFANLLSSDGFLTLPPDRSEFAPGEAFPAQLYRDLGR